MLPADHSWIMVEDEFLATARLFTRHLHEAEYRRLQNQQSVCQGSPAIALKQTKRDICSLGKWTTLEGTTSANFSSFTSARPVNKRRRLGENRTGSSFVSSDSRLSGQRDDSELEYSKASSNTSHSRKMKERAFMNLLSGGVSTISKCEQLEEREPRETIPRYQREKDGNATRMGGNGCVETGLKSDSALPVSSDSPAVKRQTNDVKETRVHRNGGALSRATPLSRAVTLPARALPVVALPAGAAQGGQGVQGSMGGRARVTDPSSSTKDFGSSVDVISPIDDSCSGIDKSNHSNCESNSALLKFSQSSPDILSSQPADKVLSDSKVHDPIDSDDDLFSTKRRELPEFVRKRLARKRSSANAGAS